MKKKKQTVLTARSHLCYVNKKTWQGSSGKTKTWTSHSILSLKGNPAAMGHYS